MNAPTLLALSGMTSGMGLAMAKMIGFTFIVLIISVVRMLGLETPIKTSAPTNASERDPLTPLELVILASPFLYLLRSVRFLLMIPFESQIITSLGNLKSLAMAVPAAPAPLITTFTLDISFPATLRAFCRAAKTTMAV